jgi:hypothetical protein
MKLAAAAAFLLTSAACLGPAGEGHEAGRSEIRREEAALTGDVSAAQPSRSSLFYIGHSLTSDIPDLVTGMAKEAGQEVQWKEQFILGSPLRWQWEQPTRGDEQFEKTYQALYTKGITSATTDVVLTDSVPRGGKELEAESIGYLGRFAAFIRSKAREARIWYYESWHCIDSGTAKGCAYDTVSPTRTLKWRERIAADRPMWDRIVKEAAPGIRMIPAGTALGKLVDEADKGKVPGFRSVKDFFDDDIHLNPYGKYFIACVHYSFLYGKSPVGMPADIKDRWGRSYWDTPNWQKKTWKAPSPAAVKKMQEVAWAEYRAANGGQQQ